MTREEAKAFLTNISYDLGTTGIEYLSVKHGEKMRDAIQALEQQPCDDAISRQAVLDMLQMRFGKELYISVHELPSVTPQPKTGHWEQYGNSWEDKFKCSECGEEQPKILCGERIIGYWSDYCPNCGAKMEVEV